MLTLQQLLESDSIATIVAKLNDNFQTLALTNGGPQGIRGPQGIPGLPGKLGPIGLTGAVGPTGNVLGIIPFSEAGVTGANIGPSIDTFPNIGKVGPWPESSYKWLLNYYGAGLPSGAGSTPKAGDVFIDHGNSGYWKFLNTPDQNGASYGPGYTTGGAYSFVGSGTWPNLGPGAGYAGQGWYFYPTDVTASGGGGSVNNVWTEDKTSYLIGNLAGQAGPYDGGNAWATTPSPLTIANARLLTKYGTVWITTGSDQLPQSEAVNDTSTIKDWGSGAGPLYKQPGRNNAGIDRLLFKMSIDGMPYLANVKARGWTGVMDITGSFDGTNDLDFPSKNNTATSLFSDTYMFRPAYDVNISDFTPLLFFSERREVGTNASNGNFSSLGYYMYTSTATAATVPPITAPVNDPYGSSSTIPNNNVSKSLHLFSTRYSPDPMNTYQNAFTGINSASTQNYGEFLLDFRKVVASNQYVCSVPSDLKLTGDSKGNAGASYDQTTGPYRNRVGQGYISSINGRVITGPSTATDFWEYGLGDGSPQGATAGYHDIVSGVDGMVNRNVWYGTSVMKEPSVWDTANVTDTELFRVAGMLERGRKFTSQNTRTSGSTVASRTHFLSELVFYTSQFNSVGTIPGATAGSLPAGGLEGNTHNSKPAFYISPYGNIGVGTFVGPNNNDLGPVEPSARFHVHTKKRTDNYDPTWTYETLTPAGLVNEFPRHVFGIAAFTGENNDGINSKAHAADVYFGFSNSLTSENIIPNSGVVNSYGASKASSATDTKLRSAIRTESWENYLINSLRLGVSPYRTPQTIGRNGADLFNKEFIFSLSPLNAEAIAANTSVSGVGVHNLFPRTRFHLFGKNINNEIVYGMEQYLPSITSPSLALTPSSTFPFYSSPNTASSKQISIDYLENSYKYPVGIYEYQYQLIGDTAGGAGFGYYPAFASLANTAFYISPNSSSYPTREALGITRSMSYSRNPFLYGNLSLGTSNGAAISANSANNSWRHGGVANGMYEPTSYLGFNLIRDLSSATEVGGRNTLGDNADSTRWLIGTQGTGGVGNRGNNGAAAFVFSPHGELGLVTIPRGNDGGLAYEQWEQRGLGTRDVLNQMKIVFDQNGNIGIGNGAGWDLDAYPSLERFFDKVSTNNGNFGKLAYVPKFVNAGDNATTKGPQLADLQSGYTAGYYFGNSQGKYGYLKYTANNTNYAESTLSSAASNINARHTNPEYIRLEIAAEKAWGRNGRSLQSLGWGYPTNETIIITGATNIQRYIAIPASWTAGDLTGVQWILTTDDEGRLISSELHNPSVNFPASTVSDWKVVVYPHPKEFNTGQALNSTINVPFTAPVGAIAAVWGGLGEGPGDLDSYSYNNPSTTTTSNTVDISNDIIYFWFATDERGSANVRLNNFVYGEGYGAADTMYPDSGTFFQVAGSYTIGKVIEKRQQSPKLILSFLERTPYGDELDKRINDKTGRYPYRKVNTVIQSAQDEAGLREYWIPKAANTGGTFMVFTDQFGRAKDDNFVNSAIIPNLYTSNSGGLYLEEVITQEFVGGYENDDGDLINTITDNVGVVYYQSTGAVKNTPALENYYGDSVNTNISTYPKAPKNLYPAYVKYSNTSRRRGQFSTFTKEFQPGEYAKLVYGYKNSAIYDNVFNGFKPYELNIAQRNSKTAPDYTSISLIQTKTGDTCISIVSDGTRPTMITDPWSVDRDYNREYGKYDGENFRGKCMFKPLGSVGTNVGNVGKWAAIGPGAGFYFHTDTDDNKFTYDPVTKFFTPQTSIKARFKFAIKLGRTYNWIRNTAYDDDPNLEIFAPPYAEDNRVTPPATPYIVTCELVESDAAMTTITTICTSVDYARIEPTWYYENDYWTVSPFADTVSGQMMPIAYTIQTNRTFALNGTYNFDSTKKYFIRFVVRNTIDDAVSGISPWKNYNATYLYPNYPAASNYGDPDQNPGTFFPENGLGYWTNIRALVVSSNPPLSDYIIGNENINYLIQHFAAEIVTEVSASPYGTFNDFIKRKPTANFPFLRLPSNGFWTNSSPAGLRNTMIALNVDPGLSTMTNTSNNSMSAQNTTRLVITDDSQFRPHYQSTVGSMIYTHLPQDPILQVPGNSYLAIYNRPLDHEGDPLEDVNRRNAYPSHVKITANVSLLCFNIMMGNFNDLHLYGQGWAEHLVPAYAFRWLPNVYETLTDVNARERMFNVDKFFTPLSVIINDPIYTTPARKRLQGLPISMTSNYRNPSTLVSPSEREGWDMSREIQTITGKMYQRLGYRAYFVHPNYPIYNRVSEEGNSSYTWPENSVVYEGEMEWLIPYDIWSGALLNNGTSLPQSPNTKVVGWHLCVVPMRGQWDEWKTGWVGSGLYWGVVNKNEPDWNVPAGGPTVNGVAVPRGIKPDTLYSAGMGISMVAPRFDIKIEEIGLDSIRGYSEPYTDTLGSTNGQRNAGWERNTLKNGHTTFHKRSPKQYERASLKRNIDYFYDIVSENNTAGDAKSSVRLRRINEDFAIIDYNITVRVSNPEIGGSDIITTLPWCLRRIDFGGPRWTQYLRFIYVPDDTGADGEQYSTWGTGWWLDNWSSYNQWYPGTAIAGPSEVARSAYGPNEILKNTSTDGSPFYSGQSAGVNATLSKFDTFTWNGNMLDLLSSFGSRYLNPAYNNQDNLPTMLTLGGTRQLVVEDNSIFRGNSIYSQLQDPFGVTTSGNKYAQDPGTPVSGGQAQSWSIGKDMSGTNGSVTNSGVYSAFGADPRLVGYAMRIFNVAYRMSAVGSLVGAPAETEAANQQFAFMRFLGANYSLWSNLSYMRNKSTQWRLSPINATNTPGMPNTTTNTLESNGFLLEVMLSDPIMHVTTPLGNTVFGDGKVYTAFAPYKIDALTTTPFRDLTVSGQAIVRFNRSTEATIERTNFS